MLALICEEKIINNQIMISQTYHQIAFYAYDIKTIEPFDMTYITAYYLPECEQRDCYLGKCRNIRMDLKECLNCSEDNKLEEILVDGFYAQRNGFIAFLQTGIRVPITKEFYPKLKEHWETQKAKGFSEEF